MTFFLNYSDDEFPSLGSRGCKVRKRSKCWSCSTPNINLTQFANNQRRQETWTGEEAVLSSSSKYDAVVLENHIKSQKPKPTEGKFKKSHRRSRIDSEKHLQESQQVLSGNPLDADSPIRQKGFANLPTKSKKVSKIKTVVLEARKECEKIRSLSTQISLNENAVLIHPRIPNEYLCKLVINGKMKELKDNINFAIRSGVGEKSMTEDVEPILDASGNVEILSSSLSNEDDSCSQISFQKLLEYSSIPSYKILIHRHNFKSYCDNCLTEELNRNSSGLISKIVRYQFNKYQTNPTKASANKRYVIGFRQVTKYIKMNKIKLFIIVPDMEDGLVDIVEELKSLANAYCIPYFFALSRRKLGFLINKKVGVCCFGILNYSGVEEKFDKTIISMTSAKHFYKEKCFKAKELYESYFNDSSQMKNSAEKNLDKIIQNISVKFTLKENTEEKDDG